ncbi:MAG: 30S ribosomal protein S16 [Candidatus Avigastranaerophilus sp.]
MKWRVDTDMVKIRLKRLGYKKNPVYRIVVLNSTTKREAAPIQQLGFYNPKTKEMQLDKKSALDWIQKGAQPTQTVKFLIDNCTEEGKLNYVKKETEKLSKKAQAKLKAEQEAAQKAAEEAAAAQKAETTEEVSA